MSVKSIVIKAVAGIVVIALLIGVAILLNNSSDEDENTPVQPLENLVEVYSADAEDVKRIDVYSDTPFTLCKTDEAKWMMEGMEGVTVKHAYAEALCKSVTNIFSPMMVKEEAENMTQYGLDNPLLQVRVVYSDSEQVMNIGSVSGEYYYFVLDGKSDVYIVSNKDLSMVFMEKMRYLDTYITNIDTNSIKKVEYGDVIVEKVGDYWFETSPYERLADDAGIKTRLLTAISTIDAESIVKRSDVSQEETDRVKIELLDGEVIEFSVHPGEQGYSYVFKDDSEYAYMIKSGALAFLNITGFELITKYVVPIAITDVQKIEMVSPSGKKEISIEAPDSEAPVFYLDGEEAVEETVRDFYADLVSLTFKGEGTASGAAEYAIIFTHIDNTKTDIRFIPLTQTDYAVSVDGKTQFTIAKKSVTDVFAEIRNIEII